MVLSFSGMLAQWAVLDKKGIATSVKKRLWEMAEIYPEPRNSQLILTQEQRLLLESFGDSLSLL